MPLQPQNITSMKQTLQSCYKPATPPRPPSRSADTLTAGQKHSRCAEESRSMRRGKSADAQKGLSRCAEETQNIIEICRNLNGICKNINGILENISDILSFIRTATELSANNGQVCGAQWLNLVRRTGDAGRNFGQRQGEHLPKRRLICQIDRLRRSFFPKTELARSLHLSQRTAMRKAQLEASKFNLQN